MLGLKLNLNYVSKRGPRWKYFSKQTYKQTYMCLINTGSRIYIYYLHGKFEHYVALQWYAVSAIYCQ